MKNKEISAIYFGQRRERASFKTFAERYVGMLGTLLGCYGLGWGMFQAGCACIWGWQLLLWCCFCGNTGQSAQWRSPAGSLHQWGEHRMLPVRHTALEPRGSYLDHCYYPTGEKCFEGSVNPAMQDTGRAPASGRSGREECVWHHLSPTNHGSEIQPSSQVPPFFLSSFYLCVCWECCNRDKE